MVRLLLSVDVGDGSRHREDVLLEVEGFHDLASVCSTQSIPFEGGGTISVHRSSGISIEEADAYKR